MPPFTSRPLCSDTPSESNLAPGSDFPASAAGGPQWILSTELLDYRRGLTLFGLLVVLLAESRTVVHSKDQVSLKGPDAERQYCQPPAPPGPTPLEWESPLCGKPGWALCSSRRVGLGVPSLWEPPDRVWGCARVLSRPGQGPPSCKADRAKSRALCGPGPGTPHPRKQPRGRGSPTGRMRRERLQCAAGDPVAPIVLGPWDGRGTQLSEAPVGAAICISL